MPATRQPPISHARALAHAFATFALALSAALAQTPPADVERVPLTFADATRAALAASSGVRNAQSEADTAARTLTRTLADPSTLRIPRLQAEHAVARANLNLAIATRAAEDALARAYAENIESEARLALVTANLEIARMALEAAEIQAAAGAVGRLDVERARNDAASSERELNEATAALDLARQRLAREMDQSARAWQLEPVPVPERVPELTPLLSSLAEHRDVVSATQQRDLAQAQLDAVNNPISSAAADIEAARERLTLAERSLRDQQDAVRLSLQSAHLNAEAARARLLSARANADAANEDERVQNVRYEAGSVSMLLLRRTQAAAQNARLAALTAAHAFAASLRALELARLGGR